MRRQGQYGDSGGNPYAAQMQHVQPSQRAERRPGHFQGRKMEMSSEQEYMYSNTREEGEWRWEREASKITKPMSPHLYSEGRSGVMCRSFYQGQRLNPEMGFETEKQGKDDNRSQSRVEDMDVGYEAKAPSHTFESLEQKFLDDILKVSKEQNDAEDAENARHREKMSTINAQYLDQLTALRTRHATRRDDVLRRESLARQRQYQQAVEDHYSSSTTAPSNNRGYGTVSTTPPAPGQEPQQAYNSNDHNSYRERSRFPGAPRDHGFGPDSYAGGRSYDTNSRFY